MIDRKTIWFTADLHVGHFNIIAYTNRPFATKGEMNETLISNYNSLVKEKDEVYILGDFGFGSADYLLNILLRLNGIKYLISGNHDHTILKHQDLFIGENKFQWIKPYYELRMDGKMIAMSHYPILSWNGQARGSWMLFGHTHGAYKGNQQSTDVGVDVHNYKPINLEQLKEYLSGLPKESLKWL